MGLEDTFRDARDAIERAAKSKKKRVAVATEVTPKKVVKDSHWCVRCDIGYPCGKR